MADALYLAVTCVAIPLSGGLAAGWTANQWTNITASWRDGCAQLAVWRDALAPMPAVAAWWLLVHLLPAKGHHRAGVTT